MLIIYYVYTHAWLTIQGGCGDSAMQSIVLLYMAMGEKDVSKIKIGHFTDYLC